MTANGFIQIALYCVVVTLLVKPFGFYMTRVFNGESHVPVATPMSGRARHLFSKPRKRA